MLTLRGQMLLLLVVMAGQCLCSTMDAVAHWQDGRTTLAVINTVSAPILAIAAILLARALWKSRPN